MSSMFESLFKEHQQLGKQANRTTRAHQVKRGRNGYK